MTQCLVGAIKLTPHPKNPALKVGTIHGKQVVVGDHYEDGVLGIFIPEGAIILDKLAEEMWVKGRLAGKQKNRVKGREMEGVPSQGLFYGSRYFLPAEDNTVSWHTGPSWVESWVDGQDVTLEIGVIFRD